MTISSSPVEFHSSRDKVLRALEARGLLLWDPSKRALPFLVWLSGERVARWAVDAASAVVVSTIEALPTGEFKEALQLYFREFVGPPQQSS